MKLLHTSDWHLGHTLHDFSRESEHEAFLLWLLDTLEAEASDALLIAGDVFETANPPASAQERWYRFLAEARSRFPDLDIVVIGGNHDSAARLDAPNPLLNALRVHVVGGLPRISGELDLERLVVPLHDHTGAIAAWVAAVPYLRVADLPRVDTTGDPMCEGVRQIYQQVLDHMRTLARPDHALIAMGHCYMMGTQLSELSERKILGGNQHALPVDVFPDDMSYVALGHLHLAQGVTDSRVNFRYSGSPIPLSLGERSYVHQAVSVTLEGAAFGNVKVCPIPRTVEMIRIPQDGAAPLDQVLAEIASLPESLPEPHPYLEIRVALEQPEPALRRGVEDALESKSVRLVKLGTELRGSPSAPNTTPRRTLRELKEEDVFLQRYHRDHEEPPPPELLEAFHELLEQVKQEAP